MVSEAVPGSQKLYLGLRSCTWVSEAVDGPEAELVVVALVGRLGGADGAVAGADGAALDLLVLVDQGGGEGLVGAPLQAGVEELVLEVRLEVLARLGVVVAAEDGPGRGRDDRGPDREAVRLVGRDGGDVGVVLRLEVLAADVEVLGVVGGQAVPAGGGVQRRRGVGLEAALAGEE